MSDCVNPSRWLCQWGIHFDTPKTKHGCYDDKPLAFWGLLCSDKPIFHRDQTMCVLVLEQKNNQLSEQVRTINVLALYLGVGRK